MIYIPLTLPGLIANIPYSNRQKSRTFSWVKPYLKLKERSHIPNRADSTHIKIAKTKGEQVWNAFGYLFFLGSIILLIAVWGSLPEKVPAHYNALGEVDRWGSKWELFILPGIGLLILLFMQFLEKHPEIHNHPKRLNETNAEQFYLLSRKLINRLKNACLIIFSLIINGICVNRFRLGKRIWRMVSSGCLNRHRHACGYKFNTAKEDRITLHGSFISAYLTVVLKNFVPAFSLQLLVLEPLVRYIFIKFIKGKSTPSAAE